MRTEPILVAKAVQFLDFGQFGGMGRFWASRFCAIAFTYVVWLIDAIRYRADLNFGVNRVSAILVVVISHAMPIAIF